MPAPATATGPVRIEKDGISLRLRLTPRSSRDEIAGTEPTAEGEALKARVRAVPEDGKANAALEQLVAGWLGVPRSTVAVVAGGKSRLKRVAVAGDGAALSAIAAARLAQRP